MRRKNPSLTMPVTNEERDLVFEIASGQPELIKYIGWIRMLAQDVKDVEYFDMLRWLKRNGCTGWKFRELIQVRCEGSVLQAIAFIRKEVHSDFGIKKLFAKPI